jgi:rhodanese-related sulfurtransferase
MAETVGMVFDPEEQIVVIAPEGQEQEVATRFARIGYDHVIGYVADPEDYLVAHQGDVVRASRLSVAEVDEAAARGDVQVVDIRNAGELEAGTLPGARHIPLAELGRRSGELDPTRPVLVYCAGGWRSSVGASLLRARGFADVSDILGGYGAWDRARATVA